MADLLLSALVPIVVQKSADLLVQRIGEMWGIADQRERLHDKLLKVQDVLTDAEEKGDANPAVKSWLAKLKSAAYDADDVLDEFCYEELRRDAVRRGHKVGNVSGFFSLENPVLFRLKMSKKLKEVVGRIDELVTEMEKFKFVRGQQGRAVPHVITHSYVNEAEVIGREKDREKLVKLLTEMCPTINPMVLPVVGMGGLGKTTLTQLVYNDPKVKEYFNLQLWICVSEEFNISRIVKLIIELVNGECKISIDNMELLQRHLREILSGKRYVLVLDDVWNEKVTEWERLRALLDCGDSGSVVIVTTRNDRVAQIMGTMESYNLRCLGEEDSWSLFHKRAFSKGVKEELVGIGKELVKNCGGLPLAIKTLGSLMSDKSEVQEWFAVLEESRIWEQRPVKDEVLPILRLSYNHLPSYMKQCFAFCAVFPKDYVMEKDKLVQYWMAHGFIPSDGLGDLEMRGSEIFNELAWRSFFQDVEHVCRDKSEHGYRSQTTCKMHDLMHDLARSVMKDECLSLLKPLQINKNLQCNMQHISLSKFPDDINDAIQCYPAARTLIPNHSQEYWSSSVQKIGFVKSNFLRVFDLSKCILEGDTMITAKKMKHLRYLHLSDLRVTAIPEAITALYLLQTLRLIACDSLSELPEGMRYMMSLRHLYIEKCNGLKCMPPGLGELECLQTLTCYIVGTGVGNKIGELKTLNLGGQLEVYNLGEVGNAREAREVNMASKPNLDHLALCWGMPNGSYSEGVISNGSEAVVVDLEVLDALKPCNKLKILQIKEYRGDKFPVWMTEYQMLENLLELYIIKCRRCTNVPPLHRLPLLQILHINCMDNLRHLCCCAFMSAECGEDAQITFPALKSFILHEMPNLDCWCEGDVGEKTSLIFPVLSNLSISDCPKLSAIPVTPLLEEIRIIGNKTLSSLATAITNVRSLTLDSKGRWENNADETLSFKPWESLSLNPWVSLQDLTIKGFNHIIPPTNGREGEELGVDVSATALQKLHISRNFWFSAIPSNSPLFLWRCFTFLEYLYIMNCDSLIYWPEEELSNLIYLREMYVRGCMNFLGSLLEPPSEMLTRQVLLPKLKQLQFYFCPNMVEVPQLPKSLEELNIENCTKLDCLPEWFGSLVALKKLQIDLCKSLKSLPSSIGCLTALKFLHIYMCPNLVEVPQLPKSLEKLIISASTKLDCLPEWLGSLVALKELQIGSCESLNSFPSSIGCLIALERLWIHGCINLESLPEGMQGLEALKSLAIYECPKIRILPEGLLQRLRSLDYLRIRGCPLLERDFQKQGKYWHLISEIPRLDIEEQGQSSKIGDLIRLISSCKIPCLSEQS